MYNALHITVTRYNAQYNMCIQGNPYIQFIYIYRMCANAIYTYMYNKKVRMPCLDTEEHRNTRILCWGL